MRILVATIILVCSCFTAQIEAMKLKPKTHEMLSNPSYAKHIDIQCYIVTRKQIGELFLQENKEINQSPIDELFLKETYLLVRCKNTGPYFAFGDLHCSLEHNPTPIAIDVIFLLPQMDQYADFVLYLGTAGVGTKEHLPKISYHWDCLYNM